MNLLLDVGFNREVAEEAALYWTKDSGSLARCIDNADTLTKEEIAELGKKAKARIRDAYSWTGITDAYEALFCAKQ